MKITCTPNPLRTIVELDDADRWWLREAMLLDMDPEDAQHLKWMNDLHSEYEAALRDIHVGDCTCVPCSCLKCWAEGYLGIDTMPGLGKHMAYKVDAAFDLGRSLDEAIDVLANWDPSPSPMWDGKLAIWEANLPRWKEEAAQAHAWLVRYRDEHFPTALAATPRSGS